MSLSKAERDFHRRVAAQSFNRTWDYLDKKRRSPEDEAQMLGLAHASRYHWGLVGTPRNQAVGDWQVSRVYAAIGQPGLALRFAKSALLACKENGLGEVMPTAYEAIARAYAVGKDAKSSREFLGKARRLLDRLPVASEERKVYLEQIEDTQRLLDKL